MLAADKALAAEISLDLKKLDQDNEEDSENETRGIEVLKKAVMDVVALSNVRNSSIVSRKGSGSWQGSRLSSSSLASHQGNKSIVADKSLNINKTPSTSNKASPSSTRVSPSNKGSPSSIKVSPVSIKDAPGSNRVSPGSIKVSPSSNQSSPKEKYLSQNMTLASKSITNEKQSTSSSQSENEEEINPLVQPQGRRSSESSTSSEASTLESR